MFSFKASSSNTTMRSLIITVYLEMVHSTSLSCIQVSSSLRWNRRSKFMATVTHEQLCIRDWFGNSTQHKHLQHLLSGRLIFSLVHATMNKRLEAWSVSSSFSLVIIIYSTIENIKTRSLVVKILGKKIMYSPVHVRWLCKCNISMILCLFCTCSLIVSLSSPVKLT